MPFSPFLPSVPVGPTGPTSPYGSMTLEYNTSMTFNWQTLLQSYNDYASQQLVNQYALTLSDLPK